MSDSSVSRDYGAVTIQLSVLAMSPLGYGAFPWLCPSLEGISLRSPYILPPLPCLAHADGTRIQWVPSLLGEPCHSQWKNDFAADLHMDRIIVVGASSGRNLTDCPHLRQGSGKCQCCSEDRTAKSAKPTECRALAVTSDCSVLWHLP